MATSWENRAAPTPFRQQLSFYLAADFIRAISSVGQSNRLITGRSWVRVPDGPLLFIYFLLFRGIAQLVEQRSPKPRVVSSILTAPARKTTQRNRLRGFLFYFDILSYTKNQLKTVQKIEHNLAYMDYTKIFYLQFYWLLVLGNFCEFCVNDTKPLRCKIC